MTLPPIPKPAADEAGDPSMDDILASIRRILNDDEKPKSSPQADDVLLLDGSMMVPDTMPAAAVPAPPPVPEVPASMPDPAPLPLPASALQQHAQPLESGAASKATGAELVAPTTATAAASSIGDLMRTLATERGTAVHRNGPTLEDLVRDEMRPLLKNWLDTHLPPLVERLVRAEIERVVSRMAT